MKKRKNNSTKREWFISIDFRKKDFLLGFSWTFHYDHSNDWPKNIPTIKRKKIRHEWIRSAFDLYVFIIPMFPIHIGWTRINKEK